MVSSTLETNTYIDAFMLSRETLATQIICRFVNFRPNRNGANICQRLNDELAPYFMCHIFFHSTLWYDKNDLTDIYILERICCRWFFSIAVNGFETNTVCKSITRYIL